MTESVPEPLKRLPSGVVGLDQVTRGGLFQGELYIITGVAGAGKTTLASQMCFHHVARGGRAVYLTLLTENHSRLLAHLATYGFYEPDAVGDTLSFFSASGALESDGVDGLFALVRQVVSDQQATLLVLDSFEHVRDYEANALTLKRLFLRLQVLCEASGCTLLLLSRPQPPDAAEYPLVDGIVVLDTRQHGLRSERTLEVAKLRGSGVLEGQHVFRITVDGLVVYPRTEALLPMPTTQATPTDERLSSGVPQLDVLLGGGIPRGSSTLLLGTPGCGKTALALQFLAAGFEAGEAGVYFGLNEPPLRLLAAARARGLDLAPAVANGQLAVLWQSPVDVVLDAYTARVLDAVRAHNARRLVLDGLIGLAEDENLARLGDVCAALFAELQALGVTTYVALELGQLFGPHTDVPLPRVAVRLDNLILLRAVERRARLYRLLSVQKVRESAFDPTIREFHITPHGIDVAQSSAGAEAILSGLTGTDVGADGGAVLPSSAKDVDTDDHDPDC